MGCAPIEVRELRWPQDLAQLERFDTSFVTSAVCDVESQARGFSLVETEVVPPLRRAYAVEWSELAAADAAIVAERNGAAVGASSMRYEQWNRRAVIAHLYVDATERGKGVGTRLLEELRARAITLNARQLFAETQSVNLPAIRFYERNGFTLVGLDTSLPDAEGAAHETAFYFASPLPV